jgi:hypothetical protein
MKLLKNKQAVMHQKNIEVNDERNILVKEKAGARNNLILFYVTILITMIFALLKVEPYVTITMAGLLLLNGILYVVHVNYFNKRL